MEEDSDKAQKWGQSLPLQRVVPPSQSSERHSMIIRCHWNCKTSRKLQQKTNYLILHIRKTYENGRDIANAIENQEPFNFDSSVPKLKISTTVETMETSPEEEIDIKHENDQYKIEYEAELQLYLK